MGSLHQFDYIFAIGMIFAFLDAWNIGANDVANSFASSISSRSLKYWQAMILAALCEFLGAVLVGNKVSDTIRNKIVSVEVFNNEPAVLMLTMACALVGSSLWLTFATAIGMPVSTTHSIVGAVIGSAIAAKGAKNIIWGWEGVAQIIASWFIAPLIAGAFSLIIFLACKFTVLDLKNFDRSLKNALLLIPVLVFVSFSILTMLIVWKGAPSLKLDELSDGAIAGSIIGVGAVAALIYLLFFNPFNRRKLIHNDWTLRWADVIKGPLLYFRPTDNIPPMPKDKKLVIDYYKGRQMKIERDTDAETTNFPEKEEIREEIKETNVSMKSESDPGYLSLFKSGPKKWPLLLWKCLTHGFTQDVISSQVNSKDALSGNLTELYSKSKFYDNKLEYLFSLLQVITAGTMSFSHGANDIANATGPLATIYLVWSTNTTSSKADVPTWILCYTAAALVIGIWTFGYRIISNLGNKLILQSPSRGFTIELGAAVTTVMATQLAIPTSTTQCAVGSTVFVGLCNKEYKAVNWRMVTWCYLGWILTLPMAGLIAGLLNGIILYAPNLGEQYLLN